MRYVTLLVIVLVFFSCKEAKKSETLPVDDTNSRSDVGLSETTHPGKMLMEAECYICHDPKAPEHNRIAPPLAMVKKRYIDSTITKEAFTEALIRWINDPEQETKMPDAHRKFGSMPYMPYPEGEIKQIADYMYNNKIEQPRWMDDDFQGKSGKIEYAKIGLDYAMAAQSQLSKNLLHAIQEKGTVGAIEYCNVEAIKLTDSVSLMKNAIIKRVSDKPRNPTNEANQEELVYINYFKNEVALGANPEPIIKMTDGEVQFYAPIKTNTLCLQCHGAPGEQIQPETLDALRALYPEDKAVGYDENQVRGIWVIRFDENSIE